MFHLSMATCSRLHGQRPGAARRATGFFLVHDSTCMMYTEILVKASVIRVHSVTSRPAKVPRLGHTNKDVVSIFLHFCRSLFSTVHHISHCVSLTPRIYGALKRLPLSWTWKSGRGSSRPRTLAMQPRVCIRST